MGMTSLAMILRLTDRAMGDGMKPRRIIGSVTAMALAMMLLPMTAAAGSELIRWHHPNASNVTGFRIVQGSGPGNYGAPLEVGLPTPSNGVYSATINISDTVDTYVAVVAYNADGSSAPSNERLIATASTPDPDPTLPPEPAPAPDLSLEDDAALFPADASALYTTNFAPGTGSEWIDTRAGNSMATDDSLFSIAGVAGTNALTTTNTATNVHSHVGVSGASSWANYEVRGRMLLTDTDGGLGVTTYSAYPNSDRYYRLRRSAGSNEPFRLTLHPEGDALACSNESTGVSPNVDTWYKFRIQTTETGSSTRIDAKVWAANTSEPSAWQASCQDLRSSRLVAGTVGVWSMGSGTKAWDDIEVIPVGSGGTGSTATPRDPPVPPILIDVIPVDG